MQICPLSTDWGDIATWVAGAATLLAVWIALHAAERERKKSIEIQEREWKREEERLRVHTARLANAFHRDLVYGARELTMMIVSLHPSNYTVLTESGADYLYNGRPQNQLGLINRFADKLDGFTDEDAIALLTALQSWNYLSGPIAVGREDLTAERAARMAANIRRIAVEMRVQHAELNDRMIRYFEHMPELERVVFDEVPSELAAKLS